MLHTTMLRNYSSLKFTLDSLSQGFNIQINISSKWHSEYENAAL